MSAEVFTTEQLPPPTLGQGGPTKAGWHQAEAFLRCRKEWQYKHIRGIGTPMANTPDAFAVGGLFHAGRAVWFTSGFERGEASWGRIVEAVNVEATKWDRPVSPDAINRSLTLLQGYVEHYSMRPKPRCLAAEYEIPAAPLHPSGDAWSERTARLDDVSYYTEALGRLCIGECKTTSSSINDTLKQYSLHGQPMLQALLWKLSPEGEAKHGPIAGVMLDVVKKGYSGRKPEFARQLIEIPDGALEWYREQLIAELDEMADVTWDSPVPRNIHSCTRIVASRLVDCPYKNLCTHGRAAASQYVLADGTPLSAWRPSQDQTTPPWR